VPIEPPIRLPDDFERRWRGAQRSATETIVNLGRAGELIGTRVTREVRKHGVPSSTALIILEILDGAGGELGVSEVAARSMVTRATLSGVFATLERERLVLRARGADDGRTTVLSLTARGRDVLYAALGPLHRAETSWCAALSEADRERLIQLLAAFR
jgi:DNA-binding MarR family transcriptional regulator